MPPGVAASYPDPSKPTTELRLRSRSVKYGGVVQAARRDLASRYRHRRAPEARRSPRPSWADPRPGDRGGRGVGAVQSGETPGPVVTARMQAPLVASSTSEEWTRLTLAGPFTAARRALIPETAPPPNSTALRCWRRRPSGAHRGDPLAATGYLPLLVTAAAVLTIPSLVVLFRPAPPGNELARASSAPPCSRRPTRVGRLPGRANCNGARRRRQPA